MQTISSRQNPIVREFRTLANEPDASGARLLLDGVRLVREALTTGLTFEHVAVSRARLATSGAERDLADELARAGTHVLPVTEPVIAAMSPVRSHSGIVALVSRTPTSAADVCQRSAGVVLGLVNVQDPGNLGALIRSAEASGTGGVLVCGTSASPFSWKAARGSMGSILRMPVATVASTEVAFSCMKECGYRLRAAVARGGHDPDAVDWSGHIGLLLGGEGEGLEARLLSCADDRVTVPMTPPVESLNVAVAGAILLYAARRQRMPS